LRFGLWPAAMLALAGLGGVRDAGVALDARPSRFLSHVEPDKVRLGEPFVYELVITHPLDQRYELRPIRDPGPFEPLQQLRERIDGPRDATTKFKLELSLFELGKKQLPDLTFDVIGPAGVAEFVAKGIEVEGLSSLPKDSEKREPTLFDIKALEEIPVRTYRALWFAVGLAAAALAAYLAYRWSKRPRRPVEEPRVSPPLDVRTIAALDALRAEDLPGKGRFREFYFRWSEILRGYLGQRYGFEALECTSSELLQSLRQLQTHPLPIAELSRFVHESDLVKFAKAPAEPIQCKQALEFGYRIVQATFSSPAAPVSTNAQRLHVS
jgi:hypothetical protein